MEATMTIPRLNKNVICLQKGMAHITPGEEEENLAFASTVQTKLMHYGYMLDKDAFTALKTANAEDIVGFHDDVQEYLEIATGGGAAHFPLYGDFPLTHMSEEDSYVMQQAIEYYSEHGDFHSFFPSLMEKSIKFEKKEYTMLRLATLDDVEQILPTLLEVNVSLTPQDMDIVKWFIKSGLRVLVPRHIPFRENMCTLAAMGIPVKVKTPTDVLRVAVHMSGGDISLPALPRKLLTSRRGATSPNPKRDEFKFKKFNREERKFLLNMLDDVCSAREMKEVREMRVKIGRWLRLGEILHPGDYKKRFPNAYMAFYLLRTTKVKSWYGKLAEAFKEGFTKGLNILIDKPGEFCRRVDWLVRNSKNIVETAEIMNKLKIVSGSTSNKVLFELYNHFSKRTAPQPGRSIMIKGARRRTKLPELPVLEQGTVQLTLTTIQEALTKKFAKLEPLGKVWIDEELKKIPLPANMRSASFALKPAVRGQRIPIGNKDAKVLRAFIHWVDKNGTLDPDLSCTFIKEDGVAQVLSYCHLSVGNSVHSGDIIARKGPCAEYVDIEVKDAISMGFKYVCVDVRNYRGGTLKQIGATFGIMEREHPQANKTWMPSTVAISHLLQSEASNTIMAVIDLESMEYIFLDVDSRGATDALNDGETVLEAVKQYAELPKFGVYQLLSLHTQARGEQVKKPEDADLQFKFADFCSDYVQVAKYMGV